MDCSVEAFHALHHHGFLLFEHIHVVMQRCHNCIDLQWHEHPKPVSNRCQKNNNVESIHELLVLPMIRLTHLQDSPSLSALGDEALSASPFRTKNQGLQTSRTCDFMHIMALLISSNLALEIHVTSPCLQLLSTLFPFSSKVFLGRFERLRSGSLHFFLQAAHLAWMLAADCAWSIFKDVTYSNVVTMFN